MVKLFEHQRGEEQDRKREGEKERQYVSPYINESELHEVNNHSTRNMLSTSASSVSSDYYSSSDVEDDYENSMDILMNFEQDHSCTEESDDDLQTKRFQPYSSLIQVRLNFIFIQMFS